MRTLITLAISTLTAIIAFTIMIHPTTSWYGAVAAFFIYLFTASYSVLTICHYANNALTTVSERIATMLDNIH